MWDGVVEQWHHLVLGSYHRDASHWESSLVRSAVEKTSWWVKVIMWLNPWCTILCHFGANLPVHAETVVLI